MSLLFATDVSATNGSTDAISLEYTGLGTEGNSFVIAALAGKNLSTVARNGYVLGKTTGAAPSTYFIQFTQATGTFTLSAGDVVGAGDVFIFTYYNI